VPYIPFAGFCALQVTSEFVADTSTTEAMRAGAASFRTADRGRLTKAAWPPSVFVCFSVVGSGDPTPPSPRATRARIFSFPCIVSRSCSVYIANCLSAPFQQLVGSDPHGLGVRVRVRVRVNALAVVGRVSHTQRYIVQTPHTTRVIGKRMSSSKTET
jgi:hypothetical protein